MIRRAEPRDLPILRKMQGCFEWTFDRDLAECLVVVDECDVPVMAAAAWKRAEVHMVSAKSDTPGMRLFMFRELHDAMEKALFCQGIGEAVTWTEIDGKCSMWRAFAKRLAALGWVKSERVSWHRRVRQHG